MIDSRNSLVGGEMPKTSILIGPPRIEKRTDQQGRSHKTCFRDGVIFRPDTGKWIKEVGTVRKKDETLTGIGEANIHVTALHVLTQDEMEEAMARLLQSGYVHLESTGVLQ